MFDHGTALPGGIGASSMIAAADGGGGGRSIGGSMSGKVWSRSYGIDGAATFDSGPENVRSEGSSGAQAPDAGSTTGSAFNIRAISAIAASPRPSPGA